MYLRFPSAVTYLIRMVLRLPPGSRLRGAVLRRALQTGFDAINRGDFESSFLLYDPQVVFITPRPLVDIGFDREYRGREARHEFQRRWTAEWGEMLFQPDEVLDFGDRLLCIGQVKGSGLSSGAGFWGDWAAVLTLSSGRVIREQPFFDSREALEAMAGGCDARAGAT
jgi:ketosteroid isomerase-like protein